MLLPMLYASAGNSAGGINWSITPYLWATDTNFDLKAGARRSVLARSPSMT